MHLRPRFKRSPTCFRCSSFQSCRPLLETPNPTHPNPAQHRMDVFDQWEGDRSPSRPSARGGAGGPNPFTPDSSPTRMQAAAARRGGGGENAALQQKPQHAVDVFSLRRIDLPAAVLGGGSGSSSAGPTPRSSARASASQAAATPARVILQVRERFWLCIVDRAAMRLNLPARTQLPPPPTHASTGRGPEPRAGAGDVGRPRRALGARRVAGAGMCVDHRD